MSNSEDIIDKAYAILFGNKQDPLLKRWEKAKEIAYNWNVPKLGEEIAKECVFEIVNHVSFPDSPTTKEIVGRIEHFATELFPELEGIDSSMDVILFLEYKYRNKEKKKEFKSNFKIR